jgi:hypothetical protein
MHAYYCLHIIVLIVILCVDIFNYLYILFELTILPPIKINVSFVSLAIVGNKTITNIYVYMLMPES